MRSCPDRASQLLPRNELWVYTVTLLFPVTKGAPRVADERHGPTVLLPDAVWLAHGRGAPSGRVPCLGWGVPGPS